MLACFRDVLLLLIIGLMLLALVGCGDDSSGDASADVGADADATTADGAMDAAPDASDATPSDGAIDADAGPCGTPSCSGHGICVEVDGDAACECDLGFVAEGADCVAMAGWFTLGDNLQVSTVTNPWEYRLVIDPEGTPYVVWTTPRSGAGRFTLGAQRFVDSAWEVLPELSDRVSGSSSGLDASVTSTGELTVLRPRWNDANPANGHAVHRFEDGAWTLVGEGVAPTNALLIRPDDVPVVARFNASNVQLWTVGASRTSYPGIAELGDRAAFLALGADGNLVVGGERTDSAPNASVHRFDGSDWLASSVLTYDMTSPEAMILVEDEPHFLDTTGVVNRLRAGAWEALPPAFADPAGCATMAKLGDTEIAVAWQASGGPSPIRVAFYDGTAWTNIDDSATTGISPFDSQCPRVATHGDLVCVLWDGLAIKCAVYQR